MVSWLEGTVLTKAEKGAVCPSVGFLGGVNKEKSHRKTWKGGFTHTHTHPDTPSLPSSTPPQTLITNCPPPLSGKLR